MSDDNRIPAQRRESFGKGAARKLRAANKIPAVVYGHGTDPQHLTLPGHEVALLLRKANAVLDLDIDGTSQLALVKDVQKDPVKQLIEHLDLIVVRRGEKVVVDVPVHVEGETATGTIFNLEGTTVSLEAEATNIPERITVDVEGAEDGTQVLASDLDLPAGTTLLSEPETLILAVSVPAAVDLGETEESEEGEGAEEGETEEAAAEREAEDSE